MTAYTHRFLARFIIQAETPLAVGSGDRNIMTDALIAKDVNGLPYIPGTAIAGVVRSMATQIYQSVDNKYRTLVERLFGYQESDEQKEKRKNNNKNDTEDLSKGSDIIFSEARILDSCKNVVDGLNMTVSQTDNLLSHYQDLPIRQHTRINSKGVNADRGKFDEEICYAGTRFCFEMEMVSDGKNEQDFKNLIKFFDNQTFRIGSGSRSGFGKVKIVESYYKCLDLNKSEHLDLYLAKSSNLQTSSNWSGWDRYDITNSDTNDWTKYKLIIEPIDSFLFGSGMGDAEADIVPVKESMVDWKSQPAQLKENLVLIPATSIKGALAHRVAFHYNKLVGNTTEKLKGLSKKDRDCKIKEFTSKNPAVVELFGYVGELNANGEIKEQKRGNIVFSDCIENKQVNDKILNHISVDRFTGGTIDGALFSEKTTDITDSDKKFVIELLVNNTSLKDTHIKNALLKALCDVCKGLLPLGGGVNRGNGIFTGELFENGTKIYPTTQKEEAVL